MTRLACQGHLYQVYPEVSGNVLEDCHLVHGVYLKLTNLPSEIVASLYFLKIVACNIVRSSRDHNMQQSILLINLKQIID